MPLKAGKTWQELQAGKAKISGGKITKKDSEKYNPSVFEKAKTNEESSAWFCMWESMSHKFN